MRQRQWLLLSLLLLLPALARGQAQPFPGQPAGPVGSVQCNVNGRMGACPSITDLSGLVTIANQLLVNNIVTITGPGPFGMVMPENNPVSCPTPVVGSDIICANSSGHGLYLSNNGGAYNPINAACVNAGAPGTVVVSNGSGGCAAGLAVDSGSSFTIPEFFNPTAGGEVDGNFFGTGVGTIFYQSFNSGAAVQNTFLVKFTTTGTVINTTTSDTTGILGAAESLAVGAGSPVSVVVQGFATLTTDGACTAGQSIVNSTTVTGTGHCTSSPGAAQVIGQSFSTIGGAGSIPVYISSSSGGSSTSLLFSGLISGTNTTAVMLVGSGASLGTTGTGTINATQIGGITVTGTPAVGNVPVATSTSAAIWQAPASVISGLQTNGMVYATSPTALASTTPPALPGMFNCGYTILVAGTVTPSCPQVGLGGRSLIGAATTDTVLFSDNATVIDHDQGASGTINQTLPTATTLGNSNFVFSYTNHSGQTDTITPTTWTIQKNTDAPAASLSVPPGAFVRIKIDPNAGNNWLADCTGCAAASFTTVAVTANGAASTPAFTVTGIPFAGTAANSFPQAYIPCNGATVPTTFSTAGTSFGINSCTGIGHAIEVFNNGAGPTFTLTPAGGMSLGAGLNVASTIQGAASVLSAAGSAIGQLGRSRFFSLADGRVNFVNNAATSNGITRFTFGTEAATNPALCLSNTIADVCDGVGTTTLGNTTVFSANGNKAFVTTNFTTAASTALQAITGLTFNFPAVAHNWNYSCRLSYSQATGTAAVAFGIQAATNNPTNIFGNGTQQITVGPPATYVSGTLATLATTTATNIVSGTPGATGTNYTVTLGGTLELGASLNAVSIMVSTATSGDAVTVLRGSSCQLF